MTLPGSVKYIILDPGLQSKRLRKNSWIFLNLFGDSNLGTSEFYFSLYAWRQSAPMWVVSLHAYLKSSHEKQIELKHGMDKQIQRATLQYVFWVWKDQCHLSGSWQTLDILYWKKFSCEQCGMAFTQISFPPAYKMCSLIGTLFKIKAE